MDSKIRTLLRVIIEFRVILLYFFSSGRRSHGSCRNTLIMPRVHFHYFSIFIFHHYFLFLRSYDSNGRFPKSPHLWLCRLCLWHGTLVARTLGTSGSAVLFALQVPRVSEVAEGSRCFFSIAAATSTAAAAAAVTVKSKLYRRVSEFKSHLQIWNPYGRLNHARIMSETREARTVFLTLDWTAPDFRGASNRYGTNGRASPPSRAAITWQALTNNSSPRGHCKLEHAWWKFNCSYFFSLSTVNLLFDCQFFF